MEKHLEKPCQRAPKNDKYFEMDGVYKNNILAHLLPFSSLIFCISLEDSTRPVRDLQGRETYKLKKEELWTEIWKFSPDLTR
jgi:hypothetical protein